MNARPGAAALSGTGIAAAAPPAANLPSALRRNFSVIIPAFNEVENVPALFAALRQTFERHRLQGEIVLVDDGSTDRTYEAASREATHWRTEWDRQGWEEPRIQILRHRRNLGKTEAMLTGAEAAAGEYLILFDADLQHSPEEFPRYLAKLAEGWDIVTGRKVGAYEKRAVSSIYNRLSQTLFDVPVRDLNSMKAFRKEILQEIALRHDWHRFFVVLAHARGYTVTEIEIELFPRHAGEGKYSGRQRILVGVGDLIVVWFYLKFSAKPMQFFGGTGLILILLGIVVGLIAILLRVAGWMPPFGYRPLLTLVLLLETVGFMLFGFGFIAELIATLRSEVEHLRRHTGSR